MELSSRPAAFSEGTKQNIASGAVNIQLGLGITPIKQAHR